MKRGFEDVLIEPGDEEMVEGAIREALDAGLSEAEIAAVLADERRDPLWVPIVAGRLGALARQRRRGSLSSPEFEAADRTLHP